MRKWIVFCDMRAWKEAPDKIGSVNIRINKPAISSDGRVMVCGEFEEERCTEVKAVTMKLAPIKVIGTNEVKERMVILDQPPADWKPEGWKEAIGEKLPEDWEAMGEE